MITLTNPFFWLSSAYFLLVIFIAFYIPGVVILGKNSFSKFTQVVSSYILGMTLWAWQGFIFGFLHVRFLSYVYLSLFLLIWIWEKRKNYKFFLPFKQKIKIDIISFLLIFIGVLIQLLPVIGYGLQYQKGVYLCCGNREDFIFHVSLTKSLVKSVPPIEPGMTGHIVVNYHYWANLVLADLIRVFHLPAFPLHFQFMTIFISLFFGLGIFAFGKNVSNTKTFTRWLLFFFYFGGDGIYAMLLFLGKNISLMTKVSSLEDGSTFLMNPPRAFAMVILIVGLTMFNNWLKTKDKKIGFLAILLFASTIGFKVYIGLFCLLGLGGVILYFIFNKKFSEVFFPVLAFPLAAIIYLSDNANSGGIFWAPFLLANNFLVQPAFGLIRFELARQIYLQHNNIPRLFIYEFLATIVFIAAISGTKIFAFFQSVKSFFSIGIENGIFLLFGLSGSLFVGLFFLQQSGGANIFNFVVSFWLLLSIPCASALVYWQNRVSKGFFIFISLFVVLLTVPRVVLNSYLNVLEYSKGYLMVTKEMTDSFLYITNNTNKNAIFIIDPNIGFDRSTPFIYAFTDRPMFLSGEQILVSHQIDVKSRLTVYNDLFKRGDVKPFVRDLKAMNADYLYTWDRNNYFATESASFINPVFSEGKVTIYEIKKEQLNALYNFLFPVKPKPNINQ